MEFRWGPGEVPLIRKLVVVLGGRVTGYRTCTLPQLTCFGALIAPTRSFHLLDNETTYTQCTHVDSVRKSLFPLSKRNHPFLHAFFYPLIRTIFYNIRLPFYWKYILPRFKFWLKGRKNKVYKIHNWFI